MYFVHDISSMRYVALWQREEGFYIISQLNEVRLYRICEANISHERERVYRQNICCIYYERERQEKDRPDGGGLFILFGSHDDINVVVVHGYADGRFAFGENSLLFSYGRGYFVGLKKII